MRKKRYYYGGEDGGGDAEGGEIPADDRGDAPASDSYEPTPEMRQKEMLQKANQLSQYKREQEREFQAESDTLNQLKQMITYIVTIFSSLLPL